MSELIKNLLGSLVNKVAAEPHISVPGEEQPKRAGVARKCLRKASFDEAQDKQTVEEQEQDFCSTTFGSVDHAHGSSRALKKGYVKLDLDREFHDYISGNVINCNSVVKYAEELVVKEDYVLQDNDEPGYVAALGQLDAYISQQLNRNFRGEITGLVSRKMMDSIEYPLNLVEDLTILVINLSRSKSSSEFTLACIGFLKMRSTQSITRNVLEGADYLLETIYYAWDTYSKHKAVKKEAEDLSKINPNLMSGIEKVRQEISDRRNCIVTSKGKYRLTANRKAFLAELTDDKMIAETIEKYIELDKLVLQDGLLEDFKNTLSSFNPRYVAKVYTHCKNLILHLLAFSILKPLGIDLTSVGYTELEKKALERKVWNSTEPIVQIVEAFIWICERVSSCVQQKSLTPLLFASKTCEQFYSETRKLKEVYKVLDVPTLLKELEYTEAKFIEHLELNIERGSNIKKFLNSSMDKEFFDKNLNDLRMMRNERLTRKFSASSRDVPFSILVFGDSGIGKSSLQDMLISYFGKLTGEECGDEYRYIKNPVAKYWDNFRSQMWAIVLDDIGFMKSDAVQGGDPTVMEVIQIVNGVPFVPDQADLEMKGKHPLRAKFVIGSTNTKTMNAEAYFSFPTAVQRRFPFVIEPKVKPEYTLPDGGLDSSKVPAFDNFPDLWTFTIMAPEKVSVTSQLRRFACSYNTLEKDLNLSQFLKWFAKQVKLHKEIQVKVNNQRDNIFKISLCDQCQLPVSICACVADNNVELQDGSEIIDELWYVFTVNVLYWGHLFYLFILAILKKIVPSCQFEMILWSNLLIALFIKLICWINGWDISMLVLLFIYAICIFGQILLCWSNPNMPILSILKSPWFYTQQGLKIAFFRFCPIPVIDVILKFQSINQLAYNDVSSSWPKMHSFVLGDNIRAKMCVPLGLVTLTTLLISFLTIIKLKNKFTKSLDEVKETVEEVRKNHIFAVESKNEVTPSPKENEAQNVWYNDSFVLTPHDVSENTTSWNSLSESDIIRKIGFNLCILKFRAENKYKVTRGLCLTGNVYLFNLHVLKELQDIFQVDVYYQGEVKGVSSNITLTMNKKLIYIDESKDIAVCEFNGLPPRRSIVSLFSVNPIDVKVNGYYLAHDELFTVRSRPVLRIRKGDNFFVEALGRNMDIWHCLAQSSTSNGDCGMPLIAQTGYGPVILGIHFLGAVNSNVACAISLSQREICAYVAGFKPQVQDGKCNLGAPSIPVGVTDLHPKSVFRYIEDNGSARVYGSLTLNRHNNRRSLVSKTPLSDVLKADGISTTHLPPDLKSYRPWRHAALDMIRPANRLDPLLLQKCTAAYLGDIAISLPRSAWNEVVPYSTFTAINGVPGLAYVDKLNKTTSMGHPYNKSKKFFIVDIPSEHGVMEPFEFTKEIMDQIESIEQSYSQGIRVKPIFSGNLKDEPQLPKKVDIGKTRVFSGSSVSWSIVVRKYCLSFVRLIQQNPLLFECAPGMVAQSKEWDMLYNYIIRFGKDRIIAGDFGAYDKSMCAEIIREAFEILVGLAVQSGNYDESDILAIRTIGVDTAFNWQNFNGDLVEFFGSNPSGHPLTVIINSLVNSLYNRYMFTRITGKDPSDFKKFVSLMTYGDDNIMSVSSQCSEFNHTALQNMYAQYGIKYTMADKDAESIPYISIDQSNFLKRSFRYDEELNCVVGPLEEESILKMLTICVKSKTVSAEEQMISIVSSAVREYFFYGRTIFNERSEYLMNKLKEVNLDIYVMDSTFPTYDSLKDLFFLQGRKNLGVDPTPLFV